MRTVYKYELEISFTIRAPIGAKIVHVGKDPNNVNCVWMEVDIEEPVVEYRFNVHGTGHTIADGYQHCHTWVDGAFVWHLYWRVS